MSKVILVSSRAELLSALSKAQGGETIKLAGGDYGSLGLGSAAGFNIKFPSTVTITSADSKNPATFTSMKLDGVQNLTMDGVRFDYDLRPEDIISHRPFTVIGGANIAIRNSTFEGDNAANGYGTAIGLAVRDSKGISLQGNEFVNWWRGVTVSNTKDVLVSGNEIHDMRSDGMNFVDVQGIKIEGNYIHDFRRSPDSGDHPDMIQFWTTGTKEPSTDIIIRNNTLDIGDGVWTQSIFMRNEMVDSYQAGPDMYYRNVLIENNTIYNSHLHGITVGETNGLIIRNNSVLHVPDPKAEGGGTSPVNVPTIRVATRSESVQVLDNVTNAISGETGKASWVVKGNAFVQSTDAFGVGYYGDVFVDSSVQSKAGEHKYIVEPGGLIDRLGAGSSAIQLSEAAKVGIPLFTIADAPGNAAARVFDASAMTLVAGKELSANSYLWTFSDGTTATGKIVTHTFPSAGKFDATLTVKMPNGTSATATSTLALKGSQVLDFGSDNGAFRAFSTGTDTLLAKVANLDGAAIQLIKTGVAASVSSGHLSALRGEDDFQVNLTLKADQAGSGGEVFRVHGAFLASVSSTGQFAVSISSSNGKVYDLRTTSAPPINDGKDHDVSFRVVDGVMRLTIDGKLAAEGSFAGTLPTSGLQGLTFGNPWGKANFVGDIKAFSIDIDVGDYKALPAAQVSSAPKEVAPVVDAPSPVKVAASPNPSFDDILHDEAWDGFSLDIGGLSANPKSLVDNAKVIAGTEGAKIVLDGEKDYVNIGRLTAYENSDKLAFSVDFTRDSDAVEGDRLVWNHQRIGLTVNEDSLTVNVATADKGFASFTARGLNISDDILHRATVMVDTKADRLQLVYDDKLVLDVTSANFEMPTNTNQLGWSLGTAWNRYYDGEIHDFRVGDDFDFMAPLAGNQNSIA